MADDAPYYRIVPFSPPLDDDASIPTDDVVGLSSPNIEDEHSDAESIGEEKYTTSGYFGMNADLGTLNNEENALLPEDRLRHVEELYQQRLIEQLPVYYPGISGCRSVVEFECLNKINEGTFGVVYRAKEKRTDKIVALKRLKMEKEHQGFPITSLREINMLLKCGNHPNVLNVSEVVVGSSMDKIYLVMEYLEHDIKSLMELMRSRNRKWTIPQVKTLMHQLLSGIEHMHESLFSFLAFYSFLFSEYVIHRDLKTSNLLLSHLGILKFYSTPVDMWSIGCIFGEFLKLEPLFPGRTEIDQLQKIFKDIGTPNEQIWPGCMELPGMRNGVFVETPFNQLHRRFSSELPDDDGYQLLIKLLTLDPNRRLSAKDALESKWFKNNPKPLPPSSFPTWPAKSEHNKKPPNEPSAPRKSVGGFTLKFDPI
uniref:cyclin-dependent kinase n=1 Tax=Meloidogyne hapla TaxID=6305 RepID=A0A1I8B7Y7_MELHA